MDKAELNRKCDELEQLLNDPDTEMEPSRVWLLLAEIAREDDGRSAGDTA